MPLFTVRNLAVKPYVLVEKGDTTANDAPPWQLSIQCLNAHNEYHAVYLTTSACIRQDFEALSIKRSTEQFRKHGCTHLN